MTKRTSIIDVAKEAGVSIATVSRVFNENSYVSGELTQKVLRAADKLNYKPSRLAQSLRRGRSKTVGFLVPDIVNPFFSSIVEGASEVLNSKDYVSIVCSSSVDASRETDLLETLRLSGIDGLVTVLMEKYNSYIDELMTRGLPVVIVDEIIKTRNVCCVASDNYGGMKRLMRFLLNTGHRSFAFLGGNPSTFSAQQRMKAFRDSLRNETEASVDILTGEYTFESGYKMTRDLERVPQAIVCGNDLIAFGAMCFLKERGFSIPADVSVTGFDDVIFSKMSDPPLTTVRQDPYLMGQTAAEMLLRQFNGGIPDSIRLLETELVMRRSTCGR
ncbi:MAG TPA: LacI family transcriptional regulator [Kosmotogaceae bacterium]|nr:MAG: Transcriptional regulator, LacI family [Thermotogales bacterium 46_20]HAA84997.1 LacI family transcriptional regulator [Kosmotogaceae bacterium]